MEDSPASDATIHNQPDTMRTNAMMAASEVKKAGLTGLSRNQTLMKFFNRLHQFGTPNGRDSYDAWIKQSPREAGLSQ
jgi:hypothetical protein